MSIGPIFVGTSPTLTDVIANGDGSLPDLTGATVHLVYIPKGQATPQVSVLATVAVDQVASPGGVFIQLGTPLTDAVAVFTAWWHVDFLNGAVLETDSFDLPVVSHVTGGTPYLTSGLFRRITRVKQSRLGIGTVNPNGDELLQYELDRAAAYIEFVTGQPATDSTLALLPTAIGLQPTSGALRITVIKAIQMRSEQTLFQAQNSYIDDATDDVVASISVGSFSQSKFQQLRAKQEKKLNSWGALSDLLFQLMTPDRFAWWAVFLSDDDTLMIPAAYSYENTIEPSLSFSGGYWGYGFGYADEYIGTHVGIGGWQGGYGNTPGGIYPLPVD